MLLGAAFPETCSYLLLTLAAEKMPRNWKIIVQVSHKSHLNLKLCENFHTKNSVPVISIESRKMGYSKRRNLKLRNPSERFEKANFIFPWNVNSNFKFQFFERKMDKLILAVCDDTI